MKRILFAATLLFVAFAKVQATEALIFDEGGYILYILIGDGDRGSTVAQVRFTPPGAKDWIPVPREQLKIEKFDEHKQVLVMHFTNQKEDPEFPPTFSFSAKKKNAVLCQRQKDHRLVRLARPVMPPRRCNDPQIAQIHTDSGGSADYASSQQKICVHLRQSADLLTACD